MTKRDQVIMEIKKSIEKGEWLPGEPIPPEHELCARYKVSRQPIRNAVSALAQMGILEPRRGSGTYVCKGVSLQKPAFEVRLDSISLADCFEIRRILETESASLAAQRASADMIEKLRALIHSIDDAKTFDEREQADLEFHGMIANATGNAAFSLLINAVNKYYKGLVREKSARLQENETPEQKQKLLENHIQVFLAIETRNPTMAGENMEKLLNASILKLSKAGFNLAL